LELKQKKLDLGYIYSCATENKLFSQIIDKEIDLNVKHILQIALMISIHLHVHGNTRLHKNFMLQRNCGMELIR
jgi:hypothetical protein